MEKSSDHIFEQFVTQLSPPTQEGSPRAFLLDGSSMRMAHTPELCKTYPPGSNQHGESHWPLLRIVVAHDLQTGLAMRPDWGVMHGAEAVSEQALLEKTIDRLPARAAVIGDANFGVFSVAHAAAQRDHPILPRLTPERARHLAGDALRDGIDRVAEWRPSKFERGSHPELPEDACVKGRLLVRQVHPNNGGAAFLLALFTTLSLSEEATFKLYGKRWAIETDLRTVKSTLRLDQLTRSTSDMVAKMVAKEVNMGIVAYNLVCALIGFASEQSGVRPRGYSFTKVRRILEAFGPLRANGPNQQAAQRIPWIKS